MDKDKLEKLYEKVEEALLEDNREKQNDSLVDALELIKSELQRPVYRDGHPCEEDWLMSIGYETEKAVYNGTAEEKLDFIEDLLVMMLDRFRVLSDGGTWMF